MSKLLVVHNSVIVRATFKELLDECAVFDYDLVSTYEEAKTLLVTRRYKYAVVDRVLKDAPNGEIIALFNKHYLAPLVFTREISEEFFDDFEGAHIVDYIKKIKRNDESFAVKRLLQLRENKEITVFVISDSIIYNSYLRHNLNLHNFKVISSSYSENFYEKVDLHPEMSLVILDSGVSSEKILKIIEYIRKKVRSKEVKIIVLVDESAAYKTSLLLSGGADDYLVKEFSRDEFYIRVYQNINKVC